MTSNFKNIYELDYNLRSLNKTFRSGVRNNRQILSPCN